MEGKISKDKKLEYYLSRIAPLSEFSIKRVKVLLNFASSIKAQRGNIKSLLDIGCSNGSLTVLLNGILNAEKICGIEISPVAAEEARKKGIEVSILNVESERLPYEDETFDVVVAGDIIEHLFDSENLLKESYRVLKDEGFLVLSTPNLASWYNRIAFIFGFQPFGTACSLHFPRGGKPKFTCSPNKWAVGDWGGEHIRVMTLCALKDLLKLHNFVILEIKGAPGVLRGKNVSLIFKFVSLADRFLSFFPNFSSWMIVKAVKLKTKGKRTQ